ncbi:MAG: hypothetical protein VX733_05050 [Candidatus Latescibacterota bacterium]|nr:hypothetical protein [Candidatus Latescibacterota bacterium]
MKVSYDYYDRHGDAFTHVLLMSQDFDDGEIASHQGDIMIGLLK